MSARADPEAERRLLMVMVAGRQSRHEPVARLQVKLQDATLASLRQTIRTRKKERADERRR